MDNSVAFHFKPLEFSSGGFFISIKYLFLAPGLFIFGKRYFGGNQAWNAASNGPGHQHSGAFCFNNPVLGELVTLAN
jgi:hypothetical protein